LYEANLTQWQDVRVKGEYTEFNRVGFHLRHVERH